MHRPLLLAQGEEVVQRLAQVGHRARRPISVQEVVSQRQGFSPPGLTPFTQAPFVGSSQGSVAGSAQGRRKLVIEHLLHQVVVEAVSGTLRRDQTPFTVQRVERSKSAQPGQAGSIADNHGVESISAAGSHAEQLAVAAGEGSQTLFHHASHGAGKDQLCRAGVGFPRTAAQLASELEQAVGVAVGHPDEGLHGFDRFGSGADARLQDGEGSVLVQSPDVEYADGEFTAKIGNEAGMVEGVKMGDEVTRPKDEITDWLYLKDGLMHGNYTMRVLLPEMDPAEAEMWESRMAPLPE